METKDGVLTVMCYGGDPRDDAPLVVATVPHTSATHTFPLSHINGILLFWQGPLNGDMAIQILYVAIVVWRGWKGGDFYPLSGKSFGERESSPLPWQNK